MADQEFKILKIEKKPSKINKIFYYIFFKGSDGKSYRTCLDPANRNFQNWQNIMKAGNVLTGIRMKKYMGRDIIDADSLPRVKRYEPKPAPDADPPIPEDPQGTMFDLDSLKAKPKKETNWG